MFSKLFRTDDSVFTRKDQRILSQYLLLWSEGRGQGDTSAAEAFLAKNHWTEAYANAAFEHFHPKRIYSAEEYAVAKEAALIFSGSPQAASELLRKHGLTAGQVEECLDQFAEEESDDELPAHPVEWSA